MTGAESLAETPRSNKIAAVGDDKVTVVDNAEERRLHLEAVDFNVGFRWYILVKSLSIWMLCYGYVLC